MGVTLLCENCDFEIHEEEGGFQHHGELFCSKPCAEEACFEGNNPSPFRSLP